MNQGDDDQERQEQSKSPSEGLDSGPEAKNPHAAALSALGAAKGGRARAQRLPAAQRSEIARQGAAARWSKTPPAKAICGSPDKPLKIADVEIACYVLEDGRRVLSQRGLQGGIGMSSGGPKGGEQRVAALVASLESKGLDAKDLTVRIREPILFILPGGGLAHGYEASVLPDLCDLVLEARRIGGILQPQQEHIAKQCEILVRGFARVGIIALVDEVTGYQDLRSKTALAEILERFVTEELRKWVATFPAEYYKEIFRLNNWKYPVLSAKRPSVIGHWTNNIVYDRLAPGIREELHRVTPRDNKGRLKHKLFQHLTEDVGHPKLREHLASVITLMRACDDWEEFMQRIDRALPRWGDTYLLPTKLPKKRRKPATTTETT